MLPAAQTVALLRSAAAMTVLLGHACELGGHASRRVVRLPVLPRLANALVPATVLLHGHKDWASPKPAAVPDSLAQVSQRHNLAASSTGLASALT